MDSPRFQRAMLLLDQGRHALAEEELRGHLADVGEDGLAYALLALALVAQKKRDEAEGAARNAIGCEPDLPEAHWALAEVLHDRNRTEEALTAIREAIGLAPTMPEFYGTLAFIEIDRRRWPDALAAAEQGLRLDPENVNCGNARALALTRLGRKAEAGEAIDRILARDPEDALSHVNRGWTLLDQREQRKAMEHFRESLRLDPDNEWARTGLVESLNARNPVYGLMLRYFLWCGKVSARAGWMVVLGGYFGFRFLMRFSDNNPEWAPFITPLLVAYVVFAVMTWLAQPLFNLTLLLHPIGRHALLDDQRAQARLVALLVAPALVLAALHFLITTQADLMWFAIATGLLSLPASAIHRCDKGWPRRTMAVITGATGAVGLAALGILEVVRPPEDSTLHAYGLFGFVVFFFSILLSQFAANGLMRASPRR